MGMEWPISCDLERDCMLMIGQIFASETLTTFWLYGSH